MRLLRSSSLRFFALVFAVQLVLAGSLLLFVRYVIADELERSSQALAEALRDDFVADWREEGTAGLRKLIPSRLASLGAHDAAVLFDDPDGNHLAGNIADWPPPVAFRSGWQVYTLYRMGRATPERIGIVTTSLPDGSHLLVGHVIERDLHIRRLTGEALVAALSLTIPLALLGAVVATRVVTSRVERIAETARAVAQGELSRRVPVEDETGDAFAELAGAINLMLGRIEALVSELRMVTDSLAHDLRSPLTRLRATVERAMRETGDEAALGALERVSAEAETLLAMLTTALEISRAEAGIGRDRLIDTDLGRMIEDLVEMYGPLAEERGFSLQAEGSARAPVHRELLGQAIANLVDNAMKYGRPGGAIGLTVTAEEGAVAIRVEDDGPGIPADRREEALRRFGRLDPARSVSGAGLGLSLAAAVARLHGGTITLGDRAPGLAVTLRLPA
ncbi:sensor histidine kinase [Sphingomonas morindae]|uniref:histidine kinase n=1 Tax=Sphingomonas morindae TaxID=1541170 RepID=A0ABY4X853_9SPHN|nr:ATP-binding protein [Sphingomonas morindae]USI73113.1 HAMP domain-containing histidine kinase [Sphingomonas morindae]